jgi:two-component system, NtrC family, sensor histidine kinase GlrK
MRRGLSHRYYPRSLQRLLAIGFAVVAAPLVLALVNAALSVQDLARQSESTIGQAAQAARGSRLLMEQALSMERVVRQYVILNDTGLVVDYAKIRANFKQTTSELSLLPLDEAQLAALNRTIDREQALYQMLGEPLGTEAQRAQLVQGFVGLSEMAKEVLNQSNLLIDREVNRVRASAADTQRGLYTQLYAALVLGLLIALLFAFLIAKPIGQLDRAIRQLGAAQFTAPIRVRGPGDLEYLGQQLEWLRHRMVALEEQKVRFLGHVSHELKTPLTALREGAELLADGTAGPLSAQQREIVSILQANGVQLQRLIEGLLDYQRTVAAIGQLDRKPLDVADVARSVADAHKLVAASRSIKLEVSAYPTPAFADRDKLRTLLDNLVSNAVKHSPEGGTVTIGVSQSGGTACVDVIDRGPGVANENREKVFDWFFQGARPLGERIQGSGLGLAITHELVRAHDGTIELVDAPAGAHFRVRLPINEGAA